MRLEAALHQRLVQQMRLAPQIIQSIEILQLPLLDLQNLIQEELDANPVLEVEEPGTAEGEAPADGAAAADAPAESGVAPADLQTDEERRAKEFERLAELDEDASFRDYLSGPRASREDASEKDRKLEAMQNTAARPASLAEYLYTQYCLRDDVDDRLADVGREIIFNLDEKGFLRYPLHEIFEFPPEDQPPPAPVALAPPSTNGPVAASAPTSAPAPMAAAAPAAEAGASAPHAERATPNVSTEPAAPPPPSVPRMRCRLAEADHALRLVQQLEPRGVGARSLGEALILQLDITDADYTSKQFLVTKHLDDIQKNRLPKIARDMNCTLDEVNRLVESIRHLSPSPGAEYSPENSPYIRPDVLIETGQDGAYTVRLVDDYLPPLRINGLYRQMLRESKDQPELKAFLQKKIEAARWLIDSIEQRRNTLLRVVTEIVRRQHAFLDHGITHHRPLKMQEVADTLGIHVSTVSRAISGKHAQSHRGIVPLKFFFSGGTEQSDGSETSRAAVKDKVEAMIKDEDAKKPLSDDEIADVLKKEGLNIARRTVTKYRKMLGIPSSRQRKSF